MTAEHTSEPGAAAPELTIPIAPIAGSSNITGAGYDAASSTLDIRFSNTGVYRYSGVSAKVHDDFLASESRGKFFAKHIRGKYPSTPVPQPKKPSTAQSAWPFPTQPGH